MRRVLVTLLALALVSPVFAALTDDSIRINGMNAGLLGIVPDEYSDLAVNPANLLKIDGSRIYLEPNRLDVNGNPKIMLGAIMPVGPVSSGLLADFGGVLTPLVCLDVNGAVMDLDGDGTNETGETSMTTNQCWDDGWIPRVVKGGGLIAGGTANDETLDRSKKTIETGERNQQTSIANYGVLAGMPLGDMNVGLRYVHDGDSFENPNNATKEEIF